MVKAVEVRVLSWAPSTKKRKQFSQFTEFARVLATLFCRPPLLRPIGRVSYGAYVYHVPILSLYDVIWPSSDSFVTWTGTLSRFGIGYLATLLIAFLSFRYIEARVLRLLARFS